MRAANAASGSRARGEVRLVAPGSPIANRRGLALIMVVAVVALLTIAVTEFTYSVQLDQHRVRNSLYALQSSLMARSGVNLAEGFLMRDEDDRVDTYADEWWLELNEFCEGADIGDLARVKCRVWDESGKININNTRDPRTDTWTKGAVLRFALRCIFQRAGPAEPADSEDGLEGRDGGILSGRLASGLQEGLDVEIIDDLATYWEQEPPPGPDGHQRRHMPEFRSLEDFAATFGISTEHLGYLRQYVTVRPRRRLRGVNINVASAAVLSAILNPDPATNCASTPEVGAILERQQDPENPILQGDIRGLMPDGDLARPGAQSQVFTVRSSLYRLEASAITNMDPDNPERGGIGQTLSEVVWRKCEEKDGDRCVLWTLRPLDWQREGGARLFWETRDDEEPDSGDDGSFS